MHSSSGFTISKPVSFFLYYLDILKIKDLKSSEQRGLDAQLLPCSEVGGPRGRCSWSAGPSTVQLGRWGVYKEPNFAKGASNQTFSMFTLSLEAVAFCPIETEYEPQTQATPIILDFLGATLKSKKDR